MKNRKFLIKTIFTTLVMIGLINSSVPGSDGDKKMTSKDLVTIAVEAGNFTVLAKALTEAELVSTLQGEGPFTVFAPTDEAFAKLPEGTLEKLLEDKEALKQILLYHVVSGKVLSKDVIKLDRATTVSGQDVSIKVNDGEVMVNNSNVISVDVMASNGVIHIIDAVLIP
jgi:uncharacterized surface protein with fasciclin (FAS1) repeats